MKWKYQEEENSGLNATVVINSLDLIWSLRKKGKFCTLDPSIFKLLISKAII